MKKVFSGLLKGLEKSIEFISALLIMVLILVAFIPIRIMFPTKIIGRKNLRSVKGGKLVASNHFSNLDIIILIVTFYPITFTRKVLAKIELAKNWLVKIVLKGIGAIFIDRSKVDMHAMKETTKQLQKGKAVIMFPEGTRNKGTSEETNTLKNGVVFFAQRADATIIPVVILHRPKLFRFNKIIVCEGYKIDKTQKVDMDQEVQRLTSVFSETRKKYTANMEE